MLKKLALGGVALAAWAGLGLTPAEAAAPWPGGNAAAQNGNTIQCGNSAIGDITALLVPLTPVTFAGSKPVDCSIRVYQNG
ncbi:hypothetical protein Misp01_07070 [Microtetraspora sp. NBRC 13810]|uniref:hypothetical protein n=1 Tax=Microtetraspora sp. NBRC 13810 TaxID=3030990 RepID=UPI0024A55DC0|nr:hypothetical protein [Microtetraspora sp. NBRC 13810]GLW05577.1 hypothetical protein Misp01_07070 [Microtetraspora sp. NBRC 13810]